MIAFDKDYNRFKSTWASDLVGQCANLPVGFSLVGLICIANSERLQLSESQPQSAVNSFTDTCYKL